MNENSKKKEEEGTKALAEALRAGGTLLSLACPVCSYPLIRIKDKVYCKICNNEVLIYKDESELPKEIRQALKSSAGSKQLDSQQDRVKHSLEKKIEALRKKLDESDDPDEIVKLSQAIEQLLATVEKMS